MWCWRYKQIIEIIKKFKDLLQLVYLRQKKFKKNTFKKREFEKNGISQKWSFLCWKNHKNLKKSLENKNCSPTRVLAVGENARGQGLCILSVLKRKLKNPSLIASGNWFAKFVRQPTGADPQGLWTISGLHLEDKDPSLIASGNWFAKFVRQPLRKVCEPFLAYIWKIKTLR